MKRANTAIGTTQYLTLSANAVDCIAVDFDAFSPLFDGIQFSLAQWCRGLHTSRSSQEIVLSASKPNGLGRGLNAYQNGINLIKNLSANQNPEPRTHSRSGGRSRLAAMPT